MLVSELAMRLAEQFRHVATHRVERRRRKRNTPRRCRTQRRSSWDGRGARHRLVDALLTDIH